MDLVTSSASGIDPDISPAGAYYQAPRVAKARSTARSTAVRAMIDAHVTPRQLGLLGRAPRQRPRAQPRARRGRSFNEVIRSLYALLGLALALAPAVAAAQTAPPESPTLGRPSPSPVPQPSSSASSPPSAFFPALGANDPCTSISAIVTRPTVSNSICTVRPNHLLVETGYQNTTAAGGGNTVAYPQMLIRIGTKVPALEFDLAPPSLMRTNAGSRHDGNDGRRRRA